MKITLGFLFISLSFLLAWMLRPTEAIPVLADDPSRNPAARIRSTQTSAASKEWVVPNDSTIAKPEPQLSSLWSLDAPNRVSPSPKFRTTPDNESSEKMQAASGAQTAARDMEHE